MRVNYRGPTYTYSYATEMYYYIYVPYIQSTYDIRVHRTCNY